MYLVCRLAHAAEQRVSCLTQQCQRKEHCDKNPTLMDPRLRSPVPAEKVWEMYMRDEREKTREIKRLELQLAECKAEVEQLTREKEALARKNGDLAYQNRMYLQEVGEQEKRLRASGVDTDEDKNILAESLREHHSLEEEREKTAKLERENAELRQRLREAEEQQLRLKEDYTEEVLKLQQRVQQLTKLSGQFQEQLEASVGS